MHEKLNIAEERLWQCVREEYGLIPISFDFLPLGHDSKAAVYRVESEQGEVFLFKASSRPLYEPACLIPRYLNDQGIVSVVAPLPTRSGTPWTRLEDWTVIVYPFIDGDTSLTGMMDEQWRETGAIFQQIHQAKLPASGFEALHKETFDPTGYIQWVRTFEADHLPVGADRIGGSASKRALYATWEEYRSSIQYVTSMLQKLAELLQKRALPQVICHADLHPANLIRDRQGHVFVIDWDEVMLAPRERDFIFIKDDAGPSPFFQGYGPLEIDWEALTYYRYERVIQDLIACAEDACLRDDLGEESKAEAARLFRVILAGGGVMDITHARATAAHLPPDLSSFDE